MRSSEIWFAATPVGDCPVLVLTRDPVADRIGSLAVAALTRTRRELVSERELSAERERIPTDCVVNVDNLHTIARVSLHGAEELEGLVDLQPSPDSRLCSGAGVTADAR